MTIFHLEPGVGVLFVGEGKRDNKLASRFLEFFVHVVRVFCFIFVQEFFEAGNFCYQSRQCFLVVFFLNYGLCKLVF